MKLFKNYKSKKQLREEIAFLKGYNQRPIIREEKDLIKVTSRYSIGERETHIPTDIIKREIARGIAREIEPMIKYDIQAGTEPGEKVVIGTICVEIN